MPPLLKPYWLSRRMGCIGRRLYTSSADSWSGSEALSGGTGTGEGFTSDADSGTAWRDREGSGYNTQSGDVGSPQGATATPSQPNKSEGRSQSGNVRSFQGAASAQEHFDESELGEVTVWECGVVSERRGASQSIMLEVFNSTSSDITPTESDSGYLINKMITMSGTAS